MSEQATASSFLIFVCAIALTSLACGGGVPTSELAAHGGGAGAPANGASGSAGAAGDSPRVGSALVWDQTGFVAPATNPFAIQGPFYFYSDCEPPSGLPCTAPDPALTGADGKAGWSASADHVCAKGTAVQVQDMMFSAQWGAGLALDLNSEGGEPGAPAVKGTFNLVQAGIVGFAVDISGAAPASVRVNLTMPGLDDSNFFVAKVPGTTTFNLSQVKQGNWVTSKTPLDATKVEAIQFQIATVASAPTPFDFCIDGIRALTASELPAGGG